MDKGIKTFGNTGIEKQKFPHYKNPIFLKNVNIDNILVSSKTSSRQKNYGYFIGYLDDNSKIKPLHLMLSETNAYVNSYDVETKWMNFIY